MGRPTPLFPNQHSPFAPFDVPIVPELIRVYLMARILATDVSTDQTRDRTAGE
jgi:hypothetical protein